MSIVKISDAKQLDEFLRGNKIAVVKVTAPSWCRPCQKMAPIFHELPSEAEFKNVGFATADVDVYKDVYDRFPDAKDGLPCFLFVHKGKSIDSLARIGIAPKARLAEQVRLLLAAANDDSKPKSYHS